MIEVVMRRVRSGGVEQSSAILAGVLGEWGEG